MIELKDVTKIFKQGEDKIAAIDHVSFRFEDGKVYALVGKSGAGKSTLLNVIGTVDGATSGTVWMDGQNLMDMTEKDKTVLRRRKLGFVYQEFHLLPMLTVKENILLPFVLEHKKSERKKQFDKNYFENMVNVLEIHTLLDRHPAQLSGGQQQRVAIARALINQPKYILADEPTGNLDSETSRQVMDYLLKSVRVSGGTLLLVTHDSELAELADYRIEVKDGKLITLTQEKEG